MRATEFLPESWWQDLDPGFLGMMGYSEEPAGEESSDQPEIVSREITAIRKSR